MPLIKKALSLAVPLSPVICSETVALRPAANYLPYNYITYYVVLII